MSAPIATPIGAPAGIALEDGYSSVIVLSVDPTLAFFEKEVQPSATDGGDAIDITTMRNLTHRTKAARSLKETGEISVTCAYSATGTLRAAIDLAVNDDTGTITQYWPDGSGRVAWGYLQKVEYQSLKEGEQPEANLTFVITNRDPVAGTEDPPVDF